MAMEEIEPEQQFLTGSITSIVTGIDIDYGGVGSGTARSRELDDFADGIDEMNGQLGRLLLIGD